MTAVRTFAFKATQTATKARFDEFIRWAEPGGLAGFDRVHRKEYDRKNPYFDYGPEFLPHSHGSNRAWFVRLEFLGHATASLFSRSRAEENPEIRNPLAMIRPGRFLAFAKAYLNVYCEIRRLKSAPKPTLKALIYLEKALRDLNGGDNDPSRLSHLCFNRAAVAIKQSDMAPGVRFDTGKALEHLSMLVQAGGRFKGDKSQNVFLGFKLISPSFSFKSPIKSPPKFGRKRPDDEEVVDSGHLTSEEVAAVGLAYRRCVERFGKDGVATYYAALMSLPLTTASMRASELQSLRADALYQRSGRHRLRIPRPKIGTEQDVPVSKILGSLSEEIFDVVRGHSAEARKALAFYIEQSPESLGGVHTLYVPKRFQALLNRPYLTSAQTHAVLDSDSINPELFPRRLQRVKSRVHFVDSPGDVYGTKYAGQVIRIGDLQKAFDRLNRTFKLPVGASSEQYISLATARKFVGHAYSFKNQLARLELHKLFSSSKVRICNSHIPREDVLAALLAEFKKSTFPHWPYTSKDKSVRLDKALAAHFESGQSSHVERGLQTPCWWLPRLLSIQNLNRWIAGPKDYGPLVFVLTDVKLGNGNFPRISVNRTRRFHHTAALLAGASPLFANELAGRQSGWQGEAYDYRTPREIVRGSIDTYDPDQESDVIGPIADQAPPPKRIVARRIFLAENAAPKHMHETGGCTRDLSLEPCDEFGECMRCDKHVWRKGDTRRMPSIIDMRDEALRIIPIARSKLRLNPRLKSIANYLQQQEEVLSRCDEILRVEADESREIGTLVTFPAAPSLMTNTELRARHRRAFGEVKQPLDS